MPLSLTPDELSDEHAGHWGYLMVTRLKNGVTLAQAKQDAARVAQQNMRLALPTPAVVAVIVVARTYLLHDVTLRLVEVCVL